MIQPVVVVIHGLIAGLLCIPGMLLFAWLFDIDIVARIIVRMLFAPLLYLRWKMRANRLRAAECVAPLEALAPGRIRSQQSQLRREPDHTAHAPPASSNRRQQQRVVICTPSDREMRRSCRTLRVRVHRPGRWSSGFPGLLSPHRFRRSRRRRRGNSEDHQIGVLGMCLGVVAQERKRQRTAGKDNAVARIWARLRLPFGWFLNWCTLCGLFGSFALLTCASSVPNPTRYSSSASSYGHGASQSANAFSSTSHSSSLPQSWHPRCCVQRL